MAKLVWTVPLLLVTLLGCSAKTNDGVSRAGIEADDSGVIVTLVLGDDTVSAIRPVELSVRIVNATDERILWGYGSSNCRLHCAVMIGEDELPAVIPRVCTMDSRPYYLDPGEHDTQTFTWLAEVREDVNQPLPPGTYSIVGVAGRYRSSPETIVVTGE
jgi:hypothetical protein